MSQFYIADITCNPQQQSAAKSLFERIATSSVRRSTGQRPLESKLSYAALTMENKQYAGSGGISENNHQYGFIPAFRNEENLEVRLSYKANGKISPVHVLEGLPPHWFIDSGQTLELKVSIVSGFVRQGCFYTRSEAAGAVKIFNLEDV